MRLDKLIITLIAVLLVSVLKAQTEPDIWVEQLMELTAEELPEDVDLSELVERLHYYQNHPIDLNRTDGTELLELQFLPQSFVENLLAYREYTGRFLSVYELQVIDGVEERLLRWLMPYVSVDTRSSLREIGLDSLLRAGRHELMVRYGRTLQQRRGYTITDEARSRYLGSPDQLLVRYRLHLSRDIQFAVNMKKDAGEAFFSGAQRYGFDFYSGSLYVRNQGMLQHAVIGDYALQLGQGAAMWNGLGFGKSAIMHGMARQATGIRPYTSTNEIRFLRGAAATIGSGRFAITPFFSWRRMDGSVSHTADGRAIVTSFGETGLHRTPSEVAGRGAVKQWVYGADVQYRHRQLRIGSAVFHTRLDAEVTAPSQLRNRFVFNGDRLWNTSLYYNYSLHGVYLFGEAAHSLGSGYAFVNGLMASLHPHLSLGLHYRNYRPDYHSFFNQGIAESNTAFNERGFYSGLVYHPSRTVEWVLYADVFRFPWLRYRVDAPSRGIDLFSQFTYTWYKKANVSVRYRFRQREENTSAELQHHTVVPVVRQQMRISGQYKVNDVWQMRSRIESSYYRKEAAPLEIGWLVYHDVICKPMNGRWSGNARIAVFNTPSYNSRIYAYENDVLYAGSFPLYHQNGIRTYINLRRRFGRMTDVWLRYALSVYRGTAEIGSGLDTIEGSRRSDVRLQVRWRF
ncbi:Helix-hairpin-helix motif-containing protein [Parapedobacter composti]|uniref:Helix-hairpin-helix motif-containing protein n=1 Tax=Parapedobacter composti TaxID=623281 RepID=A0A1I1HB73_9SPHI|nr:helix-hairpin-helix domain-containing protein [Parapedobacter composti]SFC20965.1 Helix-hairpin-helix motif-containing protein [Parapedobacter composti]